MSAIANIVAFDGAATPVSHTFVPVQVTRKDGVVEAVYREQLTSVPVEACPRVTIRETTMKSGIIRTEMKVEVPVMEAVAGNNAAGYTAAPKVAYVDSDSIVSYAHPRSTITSRRLARQLCINIAGSIATSVAPVTSGPVPEAIDLLITPT